ncbi:hypothetical protein SCHPADRAFT_926093 [Schizopora paradoxa]|uniref:Uncharacterized protein n=1 Tax=Schizopora paradoxa TaxID=27342 RepID=A0A0H2SJ90_9AGAM|nr:hypothetical protein SCHPADRAFT_926093 [Schizopora paradoxa]
MKAWSFIPRYTTNRILEGSRARLRFGAQRLHPFQIFRSHNNAVGVKSGFQATRAICEVEGQLVKRSLRKDVDGGGGGGSTKRLTQSNNWSPTNLLVYLESPTDDGRVNIEEYIRKYRQGKTKRIFQALTGSQFSSMIRFLGTLSLYPSKQATLSSGAAYGPENIFGFDGRTLFVDEILFGKRYWAFILELAKDKGYRGYQLTKEDNYWLMVAALEDAKRDLAGRRDHIKRARNYYLLSHRSKPDWTLHFRYLESLHSLDARQHADEIVSRLGNLMLWFTFLPWRLVQILRNIALTHPDRISPKARSRAVQAVQSKIRRRTPVRQNSSAMHSPSSIVSFDPSYDATSIRNVLSDIVFAAQAKSGSTRLFTDSLDWAVWETRVALIPPNNTSEEDSTAVAIAWNNVRLLAMSYGFPSLKEYRASDLDIARSPSIGWTVVCSLAAVESSIPSHPSLQPHKLSSNSNSALSDGLHETVRTLWMLWRNYVHSSQNSTHLSTTVICCVLVSFLRLATLLRDLPLETALTRHIADALVYPALYNDQKSLTEAALLAVAVEYAVMCTVIHNLHTWEDVLSQIQEARLYPAGVESSVWRDLVVNGVLTQLLRHDLTLAYSLYRAVDNSRIPIRLNSDTISALGEALASAGFVELACYCLQDKGLQETARGQILGCLLSYIARFRQHSTLEAQTIGSLTHAISYGAAHLSINSSVSWSMERYLLMLLEAGHFSEASEIVNLLQVKKPEILRPSFLHSFFSRLLASRRHRLLEEMVKKGYEEKKGWMTANHPKFIFLRRLVRSDKTSARFTSRSVAFSLHQWPSLRRFLRFNPKLAQLDDNVMSLKLTSAIRKRIDSRLTFPTDDRTLEGTVFSLVRLGRIRAAMKFVDAALASSSKSVTIKPKRMPTKVGNIILAGSLLPRRKRRGARQLRHATTRLSFLVEHRGFVPDRVTLNLVLKALLRWPRLASAQSLRTLFDRLVASGYPGLTGSPGDHGVFGTEKDDEGGFQSSFVLKDGMAGGISFARHTRPLYRMFATAFRARGDREAALKVQDALRTARARADFERVRREYHRREGRKRKRSSGDLYP